MADVALQLDLSLRLLIAAALGAAVGAEREIHGHPAGIRTHMLVALGSTLFTVLSIHGFPPSEAASGPVDPTRIAAQIVSGIGFLGAGAILKDGVVIRGLTTAASLWATAAVGMAAGAGEHLLAIVAAVIILVSLWPLNRVAERLHGSSQPAIQVRLALESIDDIAAISTAVAANRLSMVTLQTERLAKDRYQVDLTVRGRTPSVIAATIEAIDAIEGVEVISTSTAD
jgi:putative Mg2+ transporter-C (MgtC) family protein